MTSSNHRLFDYRDRASVLPCVSQSLSCVLVLRIVHADTIGSEDERLLIKPDEPWRNRDYQVVSPVAPLTDENIVRNYSAGILMFHGAVQRSHRDNADRRLGFNSLCQVRGLGQLTRVVLGSTFGLRIAVQTSIGGASMIVRVGALVAVPLVALLVAASAAGDSMNHRRSVRRGR